MPRGTKEASKKKLVKSKAKNSKKIKKEQIEKEIENTKDDKFSFDEEIVIGLKRIDEPVTDTKAKKKKAKSKKQKINQKESNPRTVRDKKVNKHKGRSKSALTEEEPEIIIKSKYMQNYEKENNSNKNRKKNIKPQKSLQEQEREKRRRKKIIRVLKWFTLLAIIVGGIVFALVSPIFNIKNIYVSGNNKISSDTIISLSGLQNNKNIFQFRTSNIQNNIKENAYINQVTINRKLPDTIEIVVEEREATFNLPFGNAYIYINNQGYILEIAKEKGNFPIITGYKTSEENLKPGNRLCTEDLEKLSDVLHILDVAASMEKDISNLITEINIADKTNYILNLEKEKKQVYLGDTTNLSTKMLWIHQFLEDEKDNEGIIFINVDLNNDGPYFRESV